MKVMVPREVVQEILDDDAWEDTVLIGVAPGTDDLGEAHWGIFEHDGKLLRVKFIEGNSYWRAEMGSWEDPFPRKLYATADEFECETVERVPVTTYEYRPI